MNKVKVGIIGAGSIVESNHLPVLKAMPNVDLCWIFDINKKRVDLLSAMYNVKGINENIDTAISNVDLCLVTIPYGVRKSYYNQIAKAGKAIYVEKPFALSTEEHNEYCNMFSTYKIAVGFQRRCYSYVDTLADIIETKAFGNLKEIEFNQGHFAMKGGGGYLSNVELAGWGVIVESSIHILDQILQFTNATNVKLLQIKSLIKNGIDYDSCFNSTISNTNNSIDVICNISSMRNLSNGLSLKFDNATIVLDTSPTTDIKVTLANGSFFNISNNATQQIQKNNLVAKSFYTFWTQVFQALEDKKPNITSGINSILTTSWIEQIYKKIS